MRFLISLAGTDANAKSVLDIGTGAGRHLRLLCELGFDPTGVDISAEGLRHCDASLASVGFKAELREAPMTALPFRDGAFDAAISFSVFQYGDESVMRAAIGELHRVLRAGGQAFVVVRSTDDYRYEIGEEIEPRTVRVKIPETNELGLAQHFLRAEDVCDYFAAFTTVAFEKTETTFKARTAKNSDWLVTLTR